MDFSNIWCWLIPALVGIISGILGYLIGKGSSTTIDNSADLKLWKDKNSKLQSDFKLGKDKNAKLQADLDACTNKLSAKAAAPVVAAIAFDANAAKAAFGKVVKEDDLKVVEGIGPKIEEMFHAGGIRTWKELSETAVARCQEILDGGGERYKVHDPASWPMQSKMCYENKWSELFKWQEEHDHGKL